MDHYGCPTPLGYRSLVKVFTWLKLTLDLRHNFSKMIPQGETNPEERNEGKLEKNTNKKKAAHGALALSSDSIGNGGHPLLRHHRVRVHLHAQMELWMSSFRGIHRVSQIDSRLEIAAAISVQSGSPLKQSIPIHQICGRPRCKFGGVASVDSINTFWLAVH